MPNEYSDLIAEDKTNDLRQSVFVAARQQPDTEAKLQALSERTGVPLEAVRLKPADVELHDRLQSFDYEKAIKESPRLSAWLADPKNAGVAHDDVDNLTGLEKTLRFGANAGRAIGSVPHQMSSNLWGIGRAVGDVLPDFLGDPIANFAARYQKGASQTAKDIRGTQAGAGFVEKSVYSGIESLGQNLAMLPLTIMSGGAAPMLTGMGLSTSGQAYGQARDKGISVPQSLAFAGSQGSVEVATELLPALTMLKAVGLKTGFGKMLAKSMAQEIPGEQVATLFQDLNEWAVLNPDKPFSSYLQERPSAAAQTLIATIVGTGGQIAVAKAAENHFGGDVQKQREQFFQALADQSTNSKLRERLPDRFKALVSKYTEDGPVQNVFVPADKFAEYFQSVGIDPLAAAEEAGAVNFREAFASGGDVVIPMADFAAHIAPTDHLNGLMQDLRLRQDELTSRESALEQANRDPNEQQMMDEVAKISAEATTGDQVGAAIEQIVSQVQEQLAGRYDANTARQLATTMRGIAVLAQRQGGDGVDPVAKAKALWDKYGLNIDTLAQQVDSVGAGGQEFDQVAYHGTKYAFNKFTLDNVGKGEGGAARGWGLYFSSREDVADWYRKSTAGGSGNTYKVSIPEDDVLLDWDATLSEQPPTVRAALMASGYTEAANDMTGGEMYRDTEDAEGGDKQASELFRSLGIKGIKYEGGAGGATSAPSKVANYVIFDNSAIEIQNVLNQSLPDTIEIDGVTRSTVNSNGKPIAQTEEWIRNFWKWFGESKVVDADGRPLVVYHGAPDVRGIFAEGFKGFSRGSVFFASDSERVANSYADPNRALDYQNAEENVIPLYLAISDPMIVDANGRHWKETEKHVDQAKDGGKDGIIIKNSIDDYNNRVGSKPSTVFAFFQPNQAKSALESSLTSRFDRKPIKGTGPNNGQFDPANASILFQSGKIDESTGLPLNEDGTVTVFHHTNAASAEKIRKTGVLKAAAEPDVYVTTRQEPDTGYGDTAVAIRVNPSLLQIDDEFPNGRVDYRLNVGKPGGSINVGVGSELNQDKRASIQFGADRKFTINLFEKADLSSFLHESGHFYLEVLGDLSDDPQADQSVKDDYAKILSFLGVSNRSEITTEHHEKFARANEAYLFEGNAPAPELRGVFQRFRAWLKVIYRELSRLNVEISDEVRGVFDRIYATDAEIEQARREANIEHLFIDAASAGMTDAEFSAYSGTVADTTAEAKETLQTKLMRVEKLKRESWWRDQRKAVATEVAAEFDDTPAAQVFDVLTAPDSELKLSRAALVERYGEQILKQLPRGYGDSRGAVYTNDGADLDSVAEVSGFDSADAMISALVNMPNRKRFIAAESERRMMERHGDLLNDVALADEAMQALHNEKREQVLRIELRAIRKQWKQAEPALRVERAKQKDQTRAAVDVARMPAPEQLRQIAAGIIGQKQVRDINPHSYLLAEKKAARLAFEAMAKRDLETAAVQKQRELLNHYLYREATRARAESESILKYMKSFESDSMRGKLGKAGDQYLDQIDGILERYEFKKITNRDLSRRDSMAAWLATQEAAGNAVNVPEEIQNDARRMNYRTVPMDELRAVRDAVKNIAHLANLKTKLVRKGKLVEFEGVVSELLGALDDAAFSSTGDIGKPNTKSDSIVSKAAAGWRKFDAAHMKVEQVVEWLDGGKIDGPWARYLFDLADDAQTQEYDLHRMVTTKIQALAEHLDKKTLADRTTVTLPGFDKPMTRYDLLSIAMNMGNAQNVQRLQDGYGWSDADLQQVRDALSLSDWKFIQGTWDAIDQLWEPMAALEKRASGLEPERVVPVEFEAQGETFRGGYFPLVYDPKRSNVGEKQADADESVQNFIAQGYGRASTNKGATKARAENFSAPVLLDYEHVIAGHMAKVIKDISHREAVIGINKILTQPQIKEGIIDKLGEGQYQEFRKWMQVLVNDRSDSLTEATGAGKWMMKFRTNTAIVTMGFKISTMMAQIAGIGPTLDVVKPREFARALTAFVQSPRETWGMVTGKSGEMRNRSNTLERDVRDALLRMRGEGGFMADVRRHAFILTAMADRVISAPTWLAGYNGALSDGLAEEDAIRAGDRAVRLSQGAGGSKDLAAVQRSSELMRLLTMYYTPFSVLYARLRDVGHQAATQGIGYMPAAAARLIALVILPAVLGDLLAGRGPDDDEDETWWAIRKSLLYPVATLPVIRDFAGYMEAGIISASGEGQMKFPPSYKLSPVVGAIEKTIRTGGNVLMGNDSKTSSEIAWDAFEVSGYMFGLPTAQPRITGEYLSDLLSGDADPENAPQLLHDALFRRDKSK